MPGPAPAGLFIYAKQPERIADFYAAVAGLREQHREPDLIALGSDDIQLLIHTIPEAIAREITISSPPVRRSEVALKFFLTVPSLAAAQAAAERFGGCLFENERWSGPGFTVRNAMDPEGNVFQLREPLAQG